MRTPKLFSSDPYCVCLHAPFDGLRIQNSQFHFLERSSRYVRWEPMCYLMNIESLHSQLVFDCFPLVLAMNVSNCP